MNTLVNSLAHTRVRIWACAPDLRLKQQDIADEGLSACEVAFQHPIIGDHCGTGGGASMTNAMVPC